MTSDSFGVANIYNTVMMIASYKPASLPVPDPVALARSNTLLAHIADEIRSRNGWLPFERYMELALYAPGLGYYSAGESFGRLSNDGSDFITAPELTPLFAQTLARAVAQLLRASQTSQILEFGAGTGAMAAGILNALATLGVPCERYQIVEVSGTLRERQRATLSTALHNPAWLDKVQWLDALPEHFEGAMLGNEVLDAMPVKLYTHRSGSWYERGVALAGTISESPLCTQLVWADRLCSLDAAENGVPADLVTSFEEHGERQSATEDKREYLVEYHFAATAFTATVTQRLARGALLLIDYGFPRDEYWHPQRDQGTLMCHYRHHAHDNPLLYPGLQDITTHVDFTAIALAGLSTDGIELLGYTSQARFLINCGILDLLSAYDPHQPAAFLPSANAVQKLLAESEMGELFKVIGFARGFDTAAIRAVSGFDPGDRSHRL